MREREEDISGRAGHLGFAVLTFSLKVTLKLQAQSTNKN